MSKKLSVPHAARAIGVHSQTVRRWIKRGIIPATRRSGPHEIDGTVVAALKAAREVLIGKAAA